MEIEPPECPVCLQPYDSTITVPRVLPCGHSACQDCLSLLPNPFPNTVRCPACNQLVKLINPSSTLPKNIDLLRFSSLFRYPQCQIVGKTVENECFGYENRVENGYLPSSSHQNPEKAVKFGSFGNPDHENAENPVKIGSLRNPGHENVENPVKNGYSRNPDHENVENSIKNGSLRNPDHQTHEKPIKFESLRNPDHRNPEKFTENGSLPYPYNRNAEKNKKIGSLAYTDCQFIPDLWTQEFFLKWNKWVVSEDGVFLELDSKDGFFSTFHGKCSMRGGSEKVSLVRIGCFGSYDDDMKLRYSYVSKIMWVLHRMKDEERDEIGLILSASSLKGVCKVYGLWYNNDDRGLYMVSERHVKNFCDEDTGLRNVFFGKSRSDELLLSSSFAMIGMEICEAIIYLHLEGLSVGCLTVRCFCFNEFGHVNIDLNECLVASRRFGRLIKGVVADRENVHESEIVFENDDFETIAFVSPDIFLELLKINGVDMRCERKLDTVLGSDVWSLGCVLLTLFYGESFLKLTIVKGADYVGFYRGLRDNVKTLLGETTVAVIKPIQDILLNCLFFDNCDRPLVTDVWKCIRESFIKPQFDFITRLTQVDKKEGKEKRCLFWGEMSKLGNGLNKEIGNGEDGDVQVEEKSKDIIEGLAENHIKCIDLKGHLDCVSGLAVGGNFLFSSSYDKTVQVWSLQNFAHVHTFKGHENKVMALVFVDKEQPLCISADSGGEIFIWEAISPFKQEPIKKLYEQKDWRYTGIHCLAVSGAEYLYTGSGDKTIKAWSLQDYTLSSVMNGHNSVVSTLAVCDGVLYSGSWDGTVRLWCLSDHSPLAVLEEAGPGNVTSVLSLAVCGQFLAVAHENGFIKIWRNNALFKSAQAHKGAIFSSSVGGKCLFTGGWDKTVNVQELLVDDFQADALSIGSIACNAVITDLFHWQGKLLVGQADRVIKVYYYGS